MRCHTPFSLTGTSDRMQGAYPVLRQSASGNGHSHPAREVTLPWCEPRSRSPLAVRSIRRTPGWFACTGVPQGADACPGQWLFQPGFPLHQHRSLLYPHEREAGIALRTIITFLADTAPEMDVYCFCFSRRDFLIYRRIPEECHHPFLTDDAW